MEIITYAQRKKNWARDAYIHRRACLDAYATNRAACP